MADRHDRIPPKSKAMLICDQVIVERDTNKVSVIGSFNSVFVPRTAPEIRPLRVFLQMTEGNASCHVTMEIHDLRLDRIVSELDPTPIQFDDRLEVVNLMGSWPVAVFDHDGAYDIVAFADSQEIDRVQLKVNFEEEEEGNGEETSE